MKAAYATVLTKMPGGSAHYLYEGSNAIEATVIAGIATGMLHIYGLSGMVQVHKTTGDAAQLAFSEVWKDGKKLDEEAVG